MPDIIVSIFILFFLLTLCLWCKSFWQHWLSEKGNTLRDSEFSQYLIAGKWWGWDLNPGLFDTEVQSLIQWWSQFTILNYYTENSFISNTVTFLHLWKVYIFCVITLNASISIYYEHILKETLCLYLINIFFLNNSYWFCLKKLSKFNNPIRNQFASNWYNLFIAHTRIPITFFFLVN